MILASKKALLDRLDFEDSLTLEFIAGEALKASTPILLSDVRQEDFGRLPESGNTQTDRFLIHLMHNFAITQTRKLNLSNGFLTDDTVTVQSRLMGDLTYEYEDVDPKYYSINKERGLVTLNGFDFTGHEISISYSSGFEVNEQPADWDESEDGVFIPEYQNVPNWLSQAAMAQAIIQIDQNNPTIRHEGKSDAESAIQNITQSYWNILGKNTRVQPLCVMPEL